MGELGVRELGVWSDGVGSEEFWDSCFETGLTGFTGLRLFGRLARVWCQSVTNRSDLVVTEFLV